MKIPHKHNKKIGMAYATSHSVDSYRIEATTFTMQSFIPVPRFVVLYILIETLVFSN